MIVFKIVQYKLVSTKLQKGHIQFPEGIFKSESIFLHVYFKIYL